MMRYSLLFTLILSLYFSLNGFAQKNDLTYTLARKDSTSLHITVSFTGNRSGSSILHLPNGWASQQDLYKSVSGLTPLSLQTRISPTDKSDSFTIWYKPGTKVIFRYVLRKDWSGALRYPLYFRPVIQPDLFYFDGYSGLVYPDLADTAHIRCRLTYQVLIKRTSPATVFMRTKRMAGLPLAWATY